MSQPTAVEYARFHGLSIDCTSEDALNYISHLPHLPHLDSENETALPDPDFSIFIQGAEFQEAKLQLSREGSSFLVESIRDPHPYPPGVFNWDRFLPERHRVRKLKVEEPLLATGDHETDVARFRRNPSKPFDLERCLDACSVIETTIDENFEDEWDDIQSNRSSKEVQERLEKEKIQTTKEALVHLSATLRDTLTEEKKEEGITQLLPRVKKLRPLCLTPPLMPEELDSSPGTYVPSSYHLEFPLRSEEDVDLDDLDIDREMQEKDRIRSDNASGSDTIPDKATQILAEVRKSPGENVENNLTFEEIFPAHGERRQARMKLEEMKLEIPMMSSPLSFYRISTATTIHSTPRQMLASTQQPGRVLHRQRHTNEPLSSPGLGTTNHQNAVNLLKNKHEPASSALRRDSSSALGDLSPITPRQTKDDEIEPTMNGRTEAELILSAERVTLQINARLEDEHSSVSDGCLKLATPKLDAVPIMPPWASSSQDEFLAHHLDGACLDSPQSCSVGLKKEIEFSWTPFPAGLMKLAINDKIKDDGGASGLIPPPQGITRSEQLLWKLPGLRLLKDEDDESDGDLEEDAELRAEMTNPVQPKIPTKRIEFDLDSIISIPAKKTAVGRSDILDETRPFSNNPTSFRKGAASKDTPAFKSNMTTFSKDFSASNALQTFLDLRGSRFKKAALPHQLSGDELAEDSIQTTQAEEENGTHFAQHLISKSPEKLNDSSRAGTVQVPSTPADTTHNVNIDELPPAMELQWLRTIVLDSALVQKHHSMVNYLETKGANKLTMVYRDLGTRFPPSSRNNTSAIHSAHMSDSPNIILNPRTGLIFTNLQALNQRSLPGQGAVGQGLGVIQSSILRLAAEYECLFVLVMTPDRDSLVQTHIDGITSFSGFCFSASKQNNLRVNPIWVSPKAGSQTATTEAGISRWTWNLICEHAFPACAPSQEPDMRPSPEVTLIHEETLWELFLRKAGMNPMAAQIVLGILKRPDTDSSEEKAADQPQSWGLRRFVEMDALERIDTFAAVLGERVLNRVNRVFDRQ